MLELIQCLVDGGHAYATDGDVYFAVRSYPAYGRLSGRDIEQMLSGARVDVDERKRDPLDFALWKAAKPGEPSWPSPWGDGRPGWHIECSAMSGRYLGNPFDIHAGGDDLVFPHHENEIAQSEACHGVTFANYWLHGGMLTIDKEKMSKSEGNFLLLKDVLGHVRPQALRLLMLQTHYRSPFDYSAERLAEATAALERVENSLRNLTWALEQSSCGETSSAVAAGNALNPSQELASRIAATREQFAAAMDDDFNTAGAVGAIFELITAANTALAEGITTAGQHSALAEAQATIVELLGVLGVELAASAESEGEEYPAELVPLAAELAGYHGDIPAEAADVLLSLRQSARADRNWPLADAVRDGLAALGFIIEDTPAGTRVVRK
jgi:cysteinyl-tRNA synthetase